MPMNSKTPASTISTRKAMERAKREGFQRIGVMIKSDRLKYLDDIKDAHHFSNRNDALDLLIREHRTFSATKERVK